MDVVRDVVRRVGRVGVHRGEIRAVRLDRRRVRKHRVVVPADTQVDVRRHVDEVADAGGQRADPVGRGQCLRRRRGGFVEVDAVVMGARMVRRDPRGAVEQRDDLRRPRLRRATGLPVVVRVRVHDGFGRQHRDVGVVGIARGELAHRVGVVARELVGIRLRIIAVAPGERLDQRPLARCRVGRVGARLHDGVDGDRHVLALHVVIHAGTERPRDAPAAQRAVDVRQRGGTKRTHAFGEVESPAEHHALVEELLRAHARRHARSFVGTDSQQLRFRHGQRAGVVQADGGGGLGLRVRGSGPQERGERKHDPAHRARRPGVASTMRRASAARRRWCPSARRRGRHRSDALRSSPRAPS